MSRESEIGAKYGKSINDFSTASTNIIEQSISQPTWKNVIKHMFIMHDDDINRINVNGYYSTIRKNLKDIGVIQTNGRKGLSKGPNWDRFYSDEDWSWFITNTNSGGYGTIVK